MYAQLKNVRIDAVATAVPAKAIRLEDEVEYFGGSKKKIERMRSMLGANIRRIAAPDITTSDLCFAAAEKLFNERKIDRSTIDAVIFVSQTPDYEIPATACILQHELGLPNSCAAFDVNQGCAGYVYGLWLASSLINAQSCRRVLLLAGDAWSIPRDPNNRIIAPIFGDGGSASLLEWSAEAHPMHFELGTDGSCFDAIIIPGGHYKAHYHRNFSENQVFFDDISAKNGTPWRLNEVCMNGEVVFEFTMRVVPQHLRSFMQKCSCSVENIDFIILHQANKQIVQNVAERAGFPPEKAPWETFSHYGNLSSASIPAVLCDMFGGQPLQNNTRLLLCGYGVGLSWASCLVQTENLYCTKVFDVIGSRDAMSNEMRIQHWVKYLTEDI